jgi:hypothetical protein
MQNMKNPDQSAGQAVHAAKEAMKGVLGSTVAA